MNKFFSWEYEQQQIAFKSMLELYNDLSAENHRIEIHLHQIQDRLTDLEMRTNEVAARLRHQSHQPASVA
jgi:hypothetical protein